MTAEFVLSQKRIVGGMTESSMQSLFMENMVFWRYIQIRSVGCIRAG